METIITKKVKAKDMTALFHSDKLNVRYFIAKNYKEEHGEDHVYKYDITIRHSEEDNVEELFKEALKAVSV